jgi:integrase/recombinase XerC
MATTAFTPPTPSEVLPLWLNDLQEADRAKGTIRRYKSAVEGFLAWYERCEQRPLTFATLTPIALVGYRNELQRTQGQATFELGLEMLLRIANGEDLLKR